MHEKIKKIVIKYLAVSLKCIFRIAVFELKQINFLRLKPFYIFLIFDSNLNEQVSCGHPPKIRKMGIIAPFFDLYIPKLNFV